jgi:hypothetical protein
MLPAGAGKKRDSVCQCQRDLIIIRPLTERRRSPDGQSTYPWIVKSTAMVNHYYWYIFDEDFGPFFLKLGSYFPYNAKVCLNGHEWLKRLWRKG